LSSLADGERFASLSVDERTNHTAHEWIRDRAPVQPGGLRGLLNTRALEDYAAKLSRHRGRRVDTELSPGDRPGTSDVNLRVAEHRPWNAYAQYSNTGTAATTKNRLRVGLVHGQLLGRDDILRVDYTTGEFDGVHAVSGSYEAPFSLRAPDWRYRLRALYSEFEASEVGFVDGRFFGEQLLAEGSIIYNALQLRDFFLDVSAGARWHEMKVDNRQVNQKATASFLVPRVGVSGERRTRVSDLRFDVDVNLGLTSDDSDTLDTLGNPNVDESFVTVRWDGNYSFYLEPLFNRAGWEDPSTPGTSTLAHEVAVALRGQWAFDNRLVPQHQQIAGGQFSVRGYKQAATSGDNLVLGSLEYRFHLPRILSPDAEPVSLPWIGPFRIRPERVYGRPDWDMVVRVFSDAARVLSSERISSESHETLFSIGAGLEMQLLRNLSLRLDAGHVLSTVGSSKTGDTRGHVLATLLY
jgi:hemolysin activation/secretion protein